MSVSVPPPVPPVPVPGEAVLRDSFGRVATDLRISLTDKCSLRCTYCMPAEGLQWLSRTERLSDDEIVRLAEVFVGLGITSIRLTGGEPLVHPTLVSVVGRLAELEPRPELSLTTNAITLDRSAAGLVEAGLDRINISLDTLDRERFAALTRRDRLDDVLAGIRAAAAAGISPLKINSVAMRDNNLDEAPALLQWALREGYELRFIEHMPLDADHIWRREHMVTAEGKPGPAVDDVHAVLVAAEGHEVGMEGIERFAFYEAAARACVVVRTSETRPYACFLVAKGIV